MLIGLYHTTSPNQFKFENLSIVQLEVGLLNLKELEDQLEKLFIK